MVHKDSFDDFRLDQSRKAHLHFFNKTQSVYLGRDLKNVTSYVNLIEENCRMGTIQQSFLLKIFGVTIFYRKEKILQLRDQLSSRLRW